MRGNKCHARVSYLWMFRTFPLQKPFEAASVVVLVFWIYYVSVITILGAEVASVCAWRRGLIKGH